jgi:PAS domain S-box-containing protein
MHHLNLKSKLIIWLQFPIIGLLFLSITISYDRYLIYTKLDMLDKIVVVSIKTKTLIYSLQKQRGFSNGYIGSNGKIFKQKIIDQEKETNKQKNELHDYLDNININYYGNDFKNSILQSIKQLDKIDEIRKNTLNLTLNEKEVNTYYTKLIDSFIKVIINTSDFSNDSTLSKQLYAHSNFINAIERIANERGLGTLAFSSKQFSYDMKSKLHVLISEQNIYLNNFERNLDKKTLKYYKNTFKGNTINESRRMRQSIISSLEKKLIVSQVNRLLGYGGIIHDFNNYLSTHDNKYIIPIKNKYNQLISLLDTYQSIDGISKKEKEYILDIKSVFSKYIEYMENIDFSKNNMKKEITNFIIIATNDKALDALNNLTFKNFFSDNSSYWFTTMTDKISLLQKIDNYLTQEIFKNTKKLSKDAKTDMNSYILLCFIIIAIIIILGRHISLSIVNSLNELLEGIDRFFKFVNKKSDDIKLIEIKSNDEIGAISKMINEKMLISKRIIDEDIIERAKQLEIEVKNKTEDLEIKNREYKILLDRFNTHVIASRTDIQGVITFVTDKFCKESGYTREELLGKSHNIARHPDVPKSLYKKMWDTIQNGEDFVSELKNIRKDKSEYWVKIIIVPEFDSQKNIIGYFSVKRKINDKIKLRELNTKLEEKVKQAIEQSRKKDQLLSYQSKLATMGEMIGVIAHQWKQPLSSLSAKIQSIKYKKNIDEDYKERFISDNMQMIHFMTNTIDDFRDFYRQDKIKEDFKILNCIYKTLNILEPQFQSSGIEISVEGDDFITNGLQSEFQHVIVNLISNAKDELLQKDMKNKKIKISTRIEEEQGIVTIEDNAGGIPEHIIEKVFEPYFTTKETGKGTGIGLYLSKTIIEETMSGDLIASNSKDGACFKIILPLS